MVKNYIDAEEKYVASVVLYAKKSGDTYLYEDSAHTLTVDRATLLNLLMKGLVLVSYDTGFYTPVSFKDSGSEVTVVIATAIATGASTSVTLKSKEPVAG